MKYELWDIYDTSTFDCGDLICTSDDIAEIRAAAKEHIEDTDGECELFIKEWLNEKE